MKKRKRSISFSRSSQVAVRKSAVVLKRKSKINQRKSAKTSKQQIIDDFPSIHHNSGESCCHHKREIILESQLNELSLVADHEEIFIASVVEESPLARLQNNTSNQIFKSSSDDFKKSLISGFGGGRPAAFDAIFNNYHNKTFLNRNVSVSCDFDMFALKEFNHGKVPKKHFSGSIICGERDFQTKENSFAGSVFSRS